MGEGVFKFFVGIAKGCARGVVTGEFKHEYEIECEKHPAESVGTHIGHTLGAVVNKVFGVFSNNT